MEKKPAASHSLWLHLTTAQRDAIVSVAARLGMRWQSFCRLLLAAALADPAMARRLVSKQIRIIRTRERKILYPKGRRT